MNPTTSVCPLLIVNQRPDINDKMRCLLWLNGYDSDSVGTLAQATQLLRRRKHALLLCCDELPDGSGTSFIEQTWEQFGTPGIVMIQRVEPNATVPALSNAMRGVLFQPCNQRDFLLAVWNIIGMATDDGRGQSDDRQPCADCRGTGTIALLVHRKPCLTCGGTGNVPLDILDLPLRRVTVLEPPTRFALYSSGIRTLRQAGRMTEGVLRLLLEMWLVDPQPVVDLAKPIPSVYD